MSDSKGFKPEKESVSQSEKRISQPIRKKNQSANQKKESVSQSEKRISQPIRKKNQSANQKKESVSQSEKRISQPIRKGTTMTCPLHQTLTRRRTTKSSDWQWHTINQPIRIKALSVRTLQANQVEPRRRFSGDSWKSV